MNSGKFPGGPVVPTGYTVVPPNKKRNSGSASDINLDQRCRKTLFACNTCKKIFDKRGNVVEHVKLHTNLKPFSCEICQKKFATKGELTKHLTCHFNEKLYLCDICGKQFPRLATLRRHLSCHGAQASRYICDTCGKSFARSDAFKAHVEFHSGNGFDCDVCGKTHKSSRGLRRHHRVQHGTNNKNEVPKPFVCSICNRGFAMKGTLKNHMVTHTDKEHRTFVNSCTICGASFYHKDSLKRHLSIHTDSRPFKCSQCHKAFREKSTLKSHQNSHSKATSRPHVCISCKRGFSRKTGLRHHVCRVQSVRVDSTSAVRFVAKSLVASDSSAASNEIFDASGNVDSPNPAMSTESLATQVAEGDTSGEGNEAESVKYKENLATLVAEDDTNGNADGAESMKANESLATLVAEDSDNDNGAESVKVNESLAILATEDSGSGDVAESVQANESMGTHVAEDDTCPSAVVIDQNVDSLPAAESVQANESMGTLVTEDDTCLSAVVIDQNVDSLPAAESVQASESMGTLVAKDDTCHSAVVIDQNVDSLPAESEPVGVNASTWMAVIDRTINQALETVTLDSATAGGNGKCNTKDMKVIPTGLSQDKSGIIDNDTDLDHWSTGWTGGTGSRDTVRDGHVLATCFKDRIGLDNIDESMGEGYDIGGAVQEIRDSVKRYGRNDVSFVDNSVTADNESLVEVDSKTFGAASLERGNATFDKRSVCYNVAATNTIGVDNVTASDNTLMEYRRADVYVTSVNKSASVTASAEHLGSRHIGVKTETLVYNENMVTNSNKKSSCEEIEERSINAVGVKPEAEESRLEPGELSLLDIKVEPLTFEHAEPSWEKISWPSKTEEVATECVDSELKTINDRKTVLIQHCKIENSL